MANLLSGTKFEEKVRFADGPLPDRNLRLLVFRYCKLYQDIYWFDQLENAFAYLDIALSEGRDAVQSDLPSVQGEVQDAMGEYFESLNEVATAIYRLLDDSPLTTEDALAAISHVWNAHACNEHPSEFRDREDKVLCELLAKPNDLP